MQPKTEAQKIKDKAVDVLNPVKEKEDQFTWSYAELYKDKDIVQNFLVPDLIPDGEVCGLIGVDGVGKTQLMSQLAFCVGRKRKHFLNLTLNVKHGNALIVATEDSKKKFTKAIVKIANALEPGHKPEEVGIHFMEGGSFSTLETFILEIERNLKLRPTDLVIIDALLDTFLLINGNPNDSSDANVILNEFQVRICNHFSCTVIFIHHASKSSARAKQEKGKFFLVKDDAQGSGRITQKPRTILGLTHDFASSSEEFSTTYTNYLHALKVNLSSRHYVKNAIHLTFDQATLLHEAGGLVNLDQFENTDRTVTDFAPTKKPMAKEIDIEQHKLNVNDVFADDDSLSRTDIVKKLKVVYGVGQNKIEEKGGYLFHLTDLGLVVQNTGIFRKGDFEAPVATMPISKEDWNKPTQSFTIKPEINTDQDDNETPF